MRESVIINDRILSDVSISVEPSDWMVIFCHGYKGYKDWGAWNLVAEEFVKQGLGFLKFNFSLNGGTLDDPIDFPDLDAFGRNTYSQEVKDLNEVIDYISGRYPKKKIALVGHSRGGGIVTLVAAQNPLISKIISWAGVCDFKRRFPSHDELERWKEKGVRYIENGRTKQDMPHYFSFYTDFVSNEQKLDILENAKKINIPHLIIHGTLDEAVQLAEAHELSAANPDAELCLLETNHTFGSRHPWEKNELPQPLSQAVEKTINFVK